MTFEGELTGMQWLKRLKVRMAGCLFSAKVGGRQTACWNDGNRDEDNGLLQ